MYLKERQANPALLFISPAFIAPVFSIHVTFTFSYCHVDFLFSPSLIWHFFCVPYIVQVGLELVILLPQPPK
jgi:hypothetical protein